MVSFNPTLMISMQHLLPNGHIQLTLPPYLTIKAVACGFIAEQSGIPRAPSFWMGGCPVFDTERVMLLENPSVWQNN